MSMLDIGIIAIIAVAVGLAVWKMIRDKKRGKCTCGCESCTCGCAKKKA